MTVALNDVRILTSLLSDPSFSFTNKSSVENVLKAWYTKRQPIASQINILAQGFYFPFPFPFFNALLALYEVFCSDNLRIAVINYLKLGGEAINGPMRVFGGIKESPASLITHFFAVAFHGTLGWLLPFPWPSNIVNAVDTLSSATATILPLMKGEHLLSPSYPILQSKL